MDGLRAAGKAICSHMESLGMHHNLNKHYSSYVTIKQLVQTDSQRSLMAAYDEYDMFVIHLPAEERTFILLSMKNVFEFKSSEIASVTSNPVGKVDKPCKQCRRNVSEDEDFCWYCGAKDPGK